MQLIDRELCITSAILENVGALNKLYYEATFEYKHNKELEIKKPMHCLSFGDIPINGDKNMYDLLCINKGDSLIGCVSIYLDYPSDVDAVIRCMYITKDERNNDIGKRVVKKLLNYFYHANYENVYICVPEFNKGAIEFIESQDFVKCEDISLSEKYNFGSECKCIDYKIVL